MKKTVLLHRGRKNEENFQIVSVNGRSWKIMKGVEVQVPDLWRRCWKTHR